MGDVRANGLAQYKRQSFLMSESRKDNDGNRRQREAQTKNDGGNCERSLSCRIPPYSSPNVGVPEDANNNDTMMRRKNEK